VADKTGCRRSTKSGRIAALLYTGTTTEIPAGREVEDDALIDMKPRQQKKRAQTKRKGAALPDSMMMTGEQSFLS
jgi:hypothetical protein